MLAQPGRVSTARPRGGHASGDSGQLAADSRQLKEEETGSKKRGREGFAKPRAAAGVHGHRGAELGYTLGSCQSRVVHAPGAEVAELADALASGASPRKGVGVQIPASAPHNTKLLVMHGETTFVLSAAGLLR